MGEGQKDLSLSFFYLNVGRSSTCCRQNYCANVFMFNETSMILSFYPFDPRNKILFSLSTIRFVKFCEEICSIGFKEA